MAFLLALLAHMRSIEMITARQGVHQEQSDMIKSCAVQALPCKKLHVRLRLALVAFDGVRLACTVPYCEFGQQL